MAATQTPALTGFVKVQVSLDWSDSSHWDGRWQQVCPFCGLNTNLRDNNGDAAHKTCVESDIEAKVLAYAQSLLPVADTARSARSRRTVKAA